MVKISWLHPTFKVEACFQDLATPTVALSLLHNYSPRSADVSPLSSTCQVSTTVTYWDHTDVITEFSIWRFLWTCQLLRLRNLEVDRPTYLYFEFVTKRWLWEQKHPLQQTLLTEVWAREMNVRLRRDAPDRSWFDPWGSVWMCHCLFLYYN